MVKPPVINLIMVSVPADQFDLQVWTQEQIAEAHAIGITGEQVIQHYIDNQTQLMNDITKRKNDGHIWYVKQERVLT